MGSCVAPIASKGGLERGGAGVCFKGKGTRTRKRSERGGEQGNWIALGLGWLAFLDASEFLDNSSPNSSKSTTQQTGPTTVYE